MVSVEKAPPSLSILGLGDPADLFCLEAETITLGFTRKKPINNTLNEPS